MVEDVSDKNLEPFLINKGVSKVRVIYKSFCPNPICTKLNLKIVVNKKVENRIVN